MSKSLEDNNESSSYRLNKGKVPVELVAEEFVWEIAKVLQGGAQKYAPNNWRKGMPFMETYGSLRRHLMKWVAGEDIDPEFGCSHLAHAACNLMFLFNYQRMGRDDLDDRQKVPLEPISGPGWPYNMKGMWSELDKCISRDIEED